MTINSALYSFEESGFRIRGSQWTADWSFTAQETVMVHIHRHRAGIFTHLITNADEFPAQEICRTDDLTLERVRKYLMYVTYGRSGESFCPFARMIEDRNGYFACDFVIVPEYELPNVATELREMFCALSPCPTRADQLPDPFTIIAAFSAPEANTSEFCAMLDRQRDVLRQSFLEEGLMLAQMHTFHARGSSSARQPQPGSEPLYVAGIPMLMVRRMHRQDSVFMKTDPEWAAFRRFFPE